MRPLIPLGHRARERTRGQSVVEFALVVPILLILLVAVADLARLYTTMITVESAAREAADFGAFYTHNWETTPVDNQSLTIAEMKRRACVAAGNLPDYEDPADPTTGECTNPTVVSIDLIEPGGGAPGGDCSAVPRSDPPCWVKVTMEYTFHLLVPLSIQFHDVTLGIPTELTFERSSTFALSDFELDE
jgi:hypothetical protein